MLPIKYQVAQATESQQKKIPPSHSTEFFCSKDRKRYGGMRDYGLDPKTQFKKLFQNRKRYGGMHDATNDAIDEYWQEVWEGFKTVNGMEACATYIEVCPISISIFKIRFHKP